MSNDSDQLSAARQSVKALNIQRQSLEMESDAIVSELTAVNPEQPTAPPMGVDTPLTDAEGFPRNDIDVFRARTLRGRLAEIKTDHRRLMQDIERLLHQIALLQRPEKVALEHQELEARLESKPKPKFDPVTGKWVVRNWDGTIAGAGRKSEHRAFEEISSNDSLPVAVGTEVATAATPMDSDESAIAATSPTADTASVSLVHAAAEVTPNQKPLARVESVATASPAAAAGLQPDDLILSFGPITESLSDVSDLVRLAAADNAVVELRVLRSGGLNDILIVLRLQPRPWNGRGLLGCHIVPA
jgi:26S proteasome regulatory subunit N4